MPKKPTDKPIKQIARGEVLFSETIYESTNRVCATDKQSDKIYDAFPFFERKPKSNENIDLK